VRTKAEAIAAWDRWGQELREVARKAATILFDPYDYGIDRLKAMGVGDILREVLSRAEGKGKS
jgi:hypothetical protein